MGRPTNAAREESAKKKAAEAAEKAAAAKAAEEKVQAEAAKKSEEKPANDQGGEYQASNEAEEKINELLRKREEYVEAINAIDPAIEQLRYGVGQNVNGRAECNGYGIGYDASDYACREVCEESLRASCKNLVARKEEMGVARIDPDSADAKFLGMDTRPGH